MQNFQLISPSRAPHLSSAILELRQVFGWRRDGGVEDRQSARMHVTLDEWPVRTCPRVAAFGAAKGIDRCSRVFLMRVFPSVVDRAPFSAAVSRNNKGADPHLFVARESCQLVRTCPQLRRAPLALIAPRAELPCASTAVCKYCSRLFCTQR